MPLHFSCGRDTQLVFYGKAFVCISDDASLCSATLHENPAGNNANMDIHLCWENHNLLCYRGPSSNSIIHDGLYLEITGEIAQFDHSTVSSPPNIVILGPPTGFLSHLRPHYRAVLNLLNAIVDEKRDPSIGTLVQGLTTFVPNTLLPRIKVDIDDNSFIIDKDGIAIPLANGIPRLFRKMITIEFTLEHHHNSERAIDYFVARAREVRTVEENCSKQILRINQRLRELSI
ncbi:hypothetical protein D9757_004880 [Collybiopsis confluens]|uniref:Uncharacterized protein n=1 Tax=Collybiopsis confluens TaxID=2823264 RepID=A0A8H5HT43_9AGAR|nr:hypothetical protein D9757_004880 [Collybiopsis confluens]